MVRTHPRAFTVIEVIVASAVALAIFGVGFFSITTTIRSRSEFDVRMRAAEHARLFFNKLEREFASAWPGPNGTGMKPGRSTGPSDTFVFDDTTESGIDTDVLQFYLKSEQADLEQDHVFVRYFLGPDTEAGKNLLCRETVIYESSASLQPELDPITDDPNLGMFDEVDQLTVVHLEWQESNRAFTPQPSPTAADSHPDKSKCTHLLINLRLKHVEKDKPTVSTFSRILPIPEAFKK